MNIDLIKTQSGMLPSLSNRQNAPENSRLADESSLKERAADGSCRNSFSEFIRIWKYIRKIKERALVCDDEEMANYQVVPWGHFRLFGNLTVYRSLRLILAELARLIRAVTRGNNMQHNSAARRRGQQ